MLSAYIGVYIHNTCTRKRTHIHIRYASFPSFLRSSPRVTIIDWEFFPSSTYMQWVKTRNSAAPVIKTFACFKRNGLIPADALQTKTSIERKRRDGENTLLLVSRIKSRICYNLNNCAADEFKILQSYLLVGNKALDYYSGRLSLLKIRSRAATLLPLDGATFVQPPPCEHNEVDWEGQISGTLELRSGF